MNKRIFDIKSHMQNVVVFSIALLLLIYSLYINLASHLNVDLELHIYLARLLLSGVELYRNDFKVNTPAIVYYTALPTFLADMFNINASYTLFAFNFAITLYALYLVSKNPIVNTQKYLLIGICYTLFILPLIFNEMQFGQKEHLFIVLAIPIFTRYLLNQKLENALEFTLLCIASLIKPYFAVIAFPVLLHALYRRNISIKYVTIFVLFQLAYYIHIFVFHPAYFSEIFPVARVAYTALTIYANNPQLRITKLILSGLLDLLLMPALYIVTSLCATTKSLRTPFIFLSVLTLFSAVIQQKGFLYHYIPFFIISLWGAILLTSQAQNSILKTLSSTICIGTILLTFIPSDNAFHDVTCNYKMLISERLTKYKNTNALYLVQDMHWSMPIINDYNIKPASIFPVMQILDGVITAKQKGYDTTYAEDYIRSHIKKGLEAKPELIIIEQPYKDNTQKFVEYDLSYLFKSGATYESYFFTDPEFYDYFAQYNKVDTLEYHEYVLEIYKRK